MNLNRLARYSIWSKDSGAHNLTAYIHHGGHGVYGRFFTILESPVLFSRYKT
jgi:hypothetical protein